MSFASTLIQLSFPVLSVGALVQGAVTLALLASLLMFFRPLLRGLLRALVLSVRPQRSRARGIAAVPRQGA